MTDLEDEPEWHITEILEAEDVDSNHVAGEQAVDRIACALGAKSVIPYVFSAIPGMLENPLWQQRHAALMTLSAIGEGCKKLMEKELGKILRFLATFSCTAPTQP